MLRLLGLPLKNVGLPLWKVCLGRRDSWWLLSDSPAASAGSSGLEWPATDVRTSADKKRGEEKKRGRKREKGGLTDAPLLEAVAPIAGTVLPRVGILALSAGKEEGETAPEVMMMWESEVDEEQLIGNQSPMRSEEKEGQAVGRPQVAEQRTGRKEDRPGSHMTRGSKYDPR
ncbi:hypothetical protein BY996DRAFT_6502728 [Phakopsora pachyrhizi]|nr:hypothetical protein BY996DRAFT_6502728 [Phakopsora pachyrhizi]